MKKLVAIILAAIAAVSFLACTGEDKPESDIIENPETPSNPEPPKDDRLCVTPKYLSEVSKKASGYGANYWINRYTILDITRLLRDKSLSFVDISDIFNFSSPAYFSRYVQQNLGMKPSDYRD